MKQFFAGLLLVVACFASQAQDTIPRRLARLGVTVKPIGFFEPFLTNFTSGVYFGLNNKFVAEVDAGWIKTWYCTHYQYANHVQKSGYKVAGELKFLPFRKNFYFAAQGFMNNYHKKGYETVWRYNRAYTEELYQDKHIVSMGGHLKVGLLIQKPERRFFMDAYAGIGYRYRQIKDSNWPEDAEFIGDENNEVLFLELDQQGNRHYVSLTLGLAVGLKLVK